MTPTTMTTTGLVALGSGGGVTPEVLEELKAALAPDWSKLSDADKKQAKYLAAAATLGDPEAQEAFRKALVIWFPLPIPPFPPILWGGVQTYVAPFVVGLIVIGIALMLM